MLDTEVLSGNLCQPAAAEAAGVSRKPTVVKDTTSGPAEPQCGGPQTVSAKTAAREALAELVHAGRNCLQRSQCGLDRLRWRLRDQPELLDLLEEAQQAQDEFAALLERYRASLA